MLSIRGITKRFGGHAAVKGCSFDLGPGEILGLIGPNGSGKTTIFNVIYNLLAPDEGEVLFRGQRITGLAPYRLARLGIGRTFQEVKLFWGLSLLENLEIAALVARRATWQARAERLLSWVGLAAEAHRTAEELSIGQQRLLELALSLMPEPVVLLLDEPAAGISPTNRDRLLQHLLELKRSGTAILLIEHNVPFVRAVCDRVVVLDQGVKIAEATSEVVFEETRVLDAYLGRGPR
jgi:branched-chain amino acid transport system ATP-binding protein